MSVSNSFLGYENSENAVINSTVAEFSVPIYNKSKFMQLKNAGTSLVNVTRNNSNP